MNLYPALRAHMGSWTYYVVKMTTRELAENVQFASQIYDDRTLDEAIQRVLDERRVKKAIVSYLERNEDRFFSSIVVAALGGDPKFYSVRITDDERFEIFNDDRRLNDTFGVLKFDGTQHYYALDGQHRLAAIRTILDRNDPLSLSAPTNFANDEISVIVVVPQAGEANESFLKKYRRLFSNLNRYAKPTDQVTNIIMDEDDAFAILTRRLITEHKFFMSPGRQMESRRVKTTKGKNLSERDPFFTSLETLYEVNKKLLNSRHRRNHGWSDEGEGLEDFKRFRPDEDSLDRLYDELKMYWDGLLTVIPDLAQDPKDMRVHSLRDGDGEAARDHLLFWPIGQELLAELTREMLDRRLPDPTSPTLGGVQTALAGLGLLDWDLHEPPWRYLLLVQDQESHRWKMRNEERKEAVRIGQRIQQWVVGLDELDEEEVAKLKIAWETRLVPPQTPESQDEMWEQIKRRRSEIKRKLAASV